MMPGQDRVQPREAAASSGALRSHVLPLTVVVALFALIACAACARATSAPSISSNAHAPQCRQVTPADAPAITWWSPPSERASGNLLRWCETIGSVVFLPAPGRPAEGAVDRIAVVSWNVHVGSGDVDALIGALRSGELTDGNRVSEFVLLLQEAYRRDETIPERIARSQPVPGRIAARTGRGPDITHTWRDDGLALLYAPAMRNGFDDENREDRGNAIASTLPLRDGVVVELPLERQRRVVAVAAVGGRTRDGRSWSLRFANVHLDTGLGLMHGGPLTARKRQAESLVTALASTAPREDRSTTIVAGDFNSILGDHEPAIAYLRQQFPDASRDTEGPTFAGPLGFRATLDHVFVGGRVTSMDLRRVANRFGSDHFPLLATITF
jgi:endonuclease/exonuclease/phosphatase family metal-dependent hydrolase